MIKKPTPKKLSVDAQQQIIEASAAQTGQARVQKSYDPDFPVFEVPVNQKVLVYVPNHTVMGPDGSVMLRMDKFAAHPVIDGRSYGNVRCVADTYNEELGLDGHCPLCDAMNENWELYNREYADVAKTKGIDPHSPEAQDALKEDRRSLAQKMVIRQAEVWYTFPIVVIDCVEKDGKMTVIPKKDAEGRINGKPMWYSIRERTYVEKWGAAFDQLENEDAEVPASPAGLWAVLNFTYQPKNGKHDKMGSARALSVTFKTMTGYEEWASYFDKLTEDWTPAKAWNTVVLDALRDMEETQQVTDSLMKPVRDKLAMYALADSSAGIASAGQVAGSADQTLASFGATPVALDSAESNAELPGYEAV